MKKNNGPLSDARKGEIALALVEYTFARREVTLNPDSEDEQRHRRSMAKKYGVTIEELQQYSAEIILPIALQKHYDGVVKTVTPDKKLDSQRVGEISISFMREEYMKMSATDLIRKITAVSKEMDIDADELKEFWIQVLLPYAVCQVTGWDKVSITGSGGE